MIRAIAALLGLTVCACAPGPDPDLAEARTSITITGQGPTGVTASATVVNQIDVHWSAVDTAVKYYVLQSANGGAFQAVASTIAPATAEAVTDLVGGVRYCYEIVAAFASGAQSEPSAQVCAVALGTNTPPVGRLRTLIIPVLPARVSSPIVGQFASIGGQGSASHWAYVPLSLEVGTTIAATRARVQDGGSGTLLVEQILSSSDSNEFFSLVAESPPSDGAGVEQYLTITGPIVTAPATQYYINVSNSANPANLDSKLWRLEIDVQ